MMFPRIIFLLTSVMLCLSFTDAAAQEAITKKRGKVRMHFPDGKLHSKGKVRNYQRQGRWQYYNPEGKVVAVANFVNDTINGFYNEWYGSGSTFITGTYCMNTKCGNWKTYAEDGTLISEENFVNGQMHGTQLFMFPSGKMREKIVAEYGVTQSRTVWYANGNLKSEEHYVKGLPHGRWVTYPELDTVPVTVDEYDNGLRHGWHYAYRGRQLTEKFHYENGKAEGEWFRWDADGNMAMHEYYTRGDRDSGFYYLHGIIVRSSHFQHQRKHGAEVDYDRSGDTLKLSWWKNGRVDSSFTYHDNGRRSSSLIYNYNLRPEQAMYTEWDTAGIKLQTGAYLADLRHGAWFTYYPDGKKRSVTNYSEGRMQGLFTKWYPNGKKMIEMNFLPAGVNTPPDAWNEKGKRLPMGSKAYTEIVEGNRPGEIFSDASQYNRPIIERRVEELQLPDSPVSSPGPGSEYRIHRDNMEEVYEPTSPPVNENTPPDSNEVFQICEVMPEFPGGPAALTQFINANLVDPRAADDHRTGTVYVEYVVERDGIVSGIKVVKGIANSPDLNQAAVDVVAKFPKHSPGLNSGRQVRCRYIVPVKFILK